MMIWVDILAAYWLFIKLLLYVVAVVILFSSMDDFFIDAYYWVRTAYRALSSKKGGVDPASLNAKDQQPIAIMVPAWQEAPVIAKMAEYAASTYDYGPYHIFIGTYPNDHDTQREVDIVATQFPNIHKVVTRQPGPTTKADCLNHIIEAIFGFERETGIHFPCVVFHDAEDVIHPLELKVFNGYVPDHDLVQLPVIPLVRGWRYLTSGHYQDEFAETHGKDVVVRESLTGNVPSAGVGTGFSRRALQTLFDLNGGQVFNTQSLTEDYDIGFQLWLHGMKETFVWLKVPEAGSGFGETAHRFAHGGSRYVCIKEYFPATFSHAVRQKSRWILGIVFQGRKSIGWPKQWGIRYILYRDRKALLTNPATFIAYFVVLNIAVMEVVTGLGDDVYWFPSLIPSHSKLWGLLCINGFFLANRLVQRFIFVTRIYGPLQGALSAPRMVWANVINFMAFFRALGQHRAAVRTGEKPAWDKTTHEFPDLLPENSAARVGGDSKNHGAVSR